MSSSQRTIAPKGPIPSPQALASELSLRRKATSACNHCRTARRKCDGLRPSCSNCLRLHKVCKFDGVDKRKKESWKATINAMEQKVAQLEEHIRQLRSDPTSQAAVDTTLGQSTQLAGDSGSSAEAMGSIFSPEDLIRKPSSHDIFDSTAKPSVPLFDTGFGEIPTEALSHAPISAFLSGVACLFYILSPEQCSNLASRIYHGNGNVRSSDICEFCTIAAVGCRYDSAIEDHACMTAYFKKALSLLCDVIEEVNMQTVRTLTCLSMYLILDRSVAARLMISCALHLARWYRLTSNYGQDVQAEWCRVFRTLISLETWLSFAVGYQHGLSEDEIQAVKYSNNMELSNVAPEEASPTTSMIQIQLSKVTLLAAEIFSRTGLEVGTSWPWERFEEVSSYLDVWHQELPACLKLERLARTDNGLPDDTRRAHFLVHMVYLEDRVLLYQHFMRQSSDVTILNIPSIYHRTYTMFAHQLAWIIHIIFRDRCPFLRNWLTIHASFHAAIALLASICQCLLTGSDPGSIETHFNDVNTCMEVLGYCSVGDPAATDFSNILKPLHRRMKIIASNSTPQTVTGRADIMNIQSLLNHPSSDASHIFDLLRQLVNTMASNNHPPHD